MDFVTIAPLLLLGVVFYLLVLRPQKKRAKAQAQMLAEVAPGTKIMTSAGIFGTVVSTIDGEVTIEVAPGVNLRMLPAAISKVMPVEEIPGDDAITNSSDESGQ